MAKLVAVIKTDVTLTHHPDGKIAYVVTHEDAETTLPDGTKVILRCTGQKGGVVKESDTVQ